VDLSCSIYQDRPKICRDYAADAFCDAIAAPTLEERVVKYLDAFGLTQEAERGMPAPLLQLRLKR